MIEAIAFLVLFAAFVLTAVVTWLLVVLVFAYSTRRVPHRRHKSDGD